MINLKYFQHIFTCKCVLFNQEKQLTCGANQNGSQAECELGNPFKRNSNVSCTYFTLVVKSHSDYCSHPKFLCVATGSLIWICLFNSRT